MKREKNLIEVAVIGRSVGLRGEQKLHLLTDFPEQFKKGAVFVTKDGEELTIERFNPSRSLVKFTSCKNVDDTKKYINKKLYATLEDTRKNCDLKEGEFFWFDIIGSKVKENDKVLGVVKDIERISSNDYLIVKTDDSLVGNGLPKIFYIPYIDQYIDRFDEKEKIVYTKNAYSILENS